jgi:hypothetical protein
MLAPYKPGRNRYKSTVNPHHHTRQALTAAALLLLAVAAPAQLTITGVSPNGALTVTNTFTNGVCTFEAAGTVFGPYVPFRQVFSTQSEVQRRVAPSGFYRACTVQISPDGPGFTNLVRSYSTLSTVAGAGGNTGSGVNKWIPSFEGQPATMVLLSRPHIAMADLSGNIYIADKDAHGVRRIRPDGTIITVAGINSPGNGPDAATPGTQVALNEPNGLFVLTNGAVHILDLQNGKIRRLSTDGNLATVVTHGGPIPSGRGLWVSEDESLIYYAAGTVVKRWTPSEGLSDYSTGYAQLGNIAMDPTGRLAVTDRNANRVYRIESNGAKTVIAGNGSTSGGGEGSLATATGLNQVRALCFLPTGGFLVGTDNGSQVWYVNTAGTIHLFLHGDAAAHTGDGPWFYDPAQARVSKVRQITLDHEGSLLIAEHDAGYIRQVRFLRYEP